MNAPSKRDRDPASTVALFVAILVVSIALALWTDWHIVVRGLVALGAGIVAATLTSVIRSRK